MPTGLVWLMKHMIPQPVVTVFTGSQMPPHQSYRFSSSSNSAYSSGGYHWLYCSEAPFPPSSNYHSLERSIPDLHHLLIFLRSANYSPHAKQNFTGLQPCSSIHIRSTFCLQLHSWALLPETTRPAKPNTFTIRPFPEQAHQHLMSSINSASIYHVPSTMKTAVIKQNPFLQW